MTVERRGDTATVGDRVAARLAMTGRARGEHHSIRLSGSSTIALNAASHSAPSAPSITR
jgi:hypothetical protein